MKNVNEFIESVVEIDFIEQSNCFGHYPFQMWVEDKDGENTMAALALGGDAAACYRKAISYIKDGAKIVYLSLDFPAIKGIDNDFVAVYSYENKELKCIAIPYDTKDGNLFKRIEEGEAINMLIDQFNNFM